MAQPGVPPAAPLMSPSFDCAKTTSVAEKLVCAHEDLAKADVQLSGLTESGVIQCSSCHGDQAQGNDLFTRLAGQHANYLVQQIKAFQHTDQRPRGAVMKQVTHALSEADAVAVANYLSSLGTGK